ncbi:MAG: phosphoenolpyruvate--protein phosphotransferase [Sandaracinaceae bacterium]|nr:phosphoenolpyruvate--protein phosphotransferase [Sandaracinaceae bacterium]
MSEARRVLSGIAASAGVAVGEVVVFDRRGVVVPRRSIAEGDVEGEVERLEQAMAAARREVEGVLEGFADDGPSEHRLLVETQLLMLGDQMISTAASAAIRSERINAEWALRRTVDAMCDRLRGADDGYFRERADDVRHVGEHLLAVLTGQRRRALPELTLPRVLVANDLTPAEAAQLSSRRVLALVTDAGSASSHTAILARALAIPAVVGLSDATRALAPGDLVVVDALRGEVVVGADANELDAARARGARFAAFRERLRDAERQGIATEDGARVTLLANVDLELDVPEAKQEGAAGIGLYRTEFLYLERREPPNEEEQLAVYARVARRMAPRPVVFRTFDLGADKMPNAMRRGPNPALGLRAVRIAFERPELLVTQLRAILRAAADGDVRVMFPMIASVSDLRRARAMLETAREDLEAEGATYGPIRVGAMLEIPSAIVMADRLAPECDFFSIGTNDLTQYTLAVDRSDPRVAHLASSLDPSVLRLLLRAREVADAHERPIGVCGDLAADTVAAPLLVGLGFRTLSMAPAAIPLVAEALSRVDLGEAASVAREALEQDGVAEVERLVAARFGARLGELWDEQGIELPR